MRPPLITIRFYIAPPASPGRTGLRNASRNQSNQPDSTFSLLPIGILVNSSPPYIGVGDLLRAGPITVFEKFFSRRPPALTGAPPVRRVKTHSAQSGYVYQYYYEGQRPFRAGAGTEFVFTVSSDRKNWRPTGVRLGDAPVAAWESAHGRQLSGNERYAIAKMALFQAFDERATPASMKDDVVVLAAGVESIAEMLGL